MKFLYLGLCICINPASFSLFRLQLSMQNLHQNQLLPQIAYTTERSVKDIETEMLNADLPRNTSLLSAFFPALLR